MPDSPCIKGDPLRAPCKPSNIIDVLFEGFNEDVLNTLCNDSEILGGIYVDLSQKHDSINRQTYRLKRTAAVVLIRAKFKVS